MSRLSGGQITGVVLAWFGALLMISVGVGDVLTDVLQISIDVGGLPAAYALLRVLAAVLAIALLPLGVVALVTGARGVAVAIGSCALGVSAVLVVSEILVNIEVSRQIGLGRYYQFADGWFHWSYGLIYSIAVILCLLVAGVLCFVGRRARPAVTAQVTTAPPPPPGPMRYYLHVAGQEYGPYGADQVRQFVAEGRVIGTSPIRPEGGTYQPASQVPGLLPSDR